MVSVVRCWKAEYQKCKHSILLYMHSMIPIICAAIFAGYYHISRWELATKISAYLEVLAVAFPFLIGIIVGLVVQIENQAGHYQLLLGTIPSRTATYIGKLGFLMICAFGATFLALGTFAALYRGCSGKPLPESRDSIVDYHASHLPDSFVCGNELRKRCIYGIGNCREFNSCPYDNRAW